MADIGDKIRKKIVTACKDLKFWAKLKTTDWSTVKKRIVLFCAVQKQSGGKIKTGQKISVTS